jgi:protein-L-isoaspartate(D-aspartate) O-methyltransferase
MVHDDLRGRGVRDPQVLAAMLAVPREEFVPPELDDRAYADRPLPIGHGQTISQPYIVALMTQALKLRPTDRVLEIGAGSGYGAAVLARLASEVYTVERLPELAEAARERLARLGFDNVRVRCGDGTLGWAAHAPYDAISVTAAAPAVPRALLAQLVIGGRLVMPIGGRGGQRLVTITRTRADDCTIADLGPVEFVPLIGDEGWPDPAG